MDGGGEVAVKRTKLATADGGGRDRISDLPDELLHRILLLLPSTFAAAQTSVLSRRWRRVWADLPDLTLSDPTSDDGFSADRVDAALAASAAPKIRRLAISTSSGVATDRLAAWLRLAARRVAGELHISSTMPPEPHVVEEQEVELPRFEKATVVSLTLDYFHLALPPSGAFATLRKLRLNGVGFQPQCALGEAVSSPQCPLLQELELNCTLVPGNLTLRSESLERVVLVDIHHCLGLSIVAPMLRVLIVSNGNFGSQWDVDISAPGLEELTWYMLKEVRSFRFSSSGSLRLLKLANIYQSGRNLGFARLLQCLTHVDQLDFRVCLSRDLHGYQYVVEDIMKLPDIMSLNIHLKMNGHSFGPCLLHLLRMSTGIRKLNLELLPTEKYLGVNFVEGCSSYCFCNQSPGWRTQDISLNFLQEANIDGLTGAEHEVDSVKVLFRCAKALKKMAINFHLAVPSQKEISEKLVSFAGTETTVTVSGV